MLASKLFYNFELIQFIGFGIALLIAFFLTPVVQSRAQKIGLLDKPSMRKIHTTPIPRLGGVSIYASIFITSLTLSFIYWQYRATGFSGFTLLGILGGGTIIFFLGLLDDIEPIPAKLKLLIQILAASVAWFLGVKIKYILNPCYHVDLGIFEFSLGNQIVSFDDVFSYIITMLWIVGITNAINLIDGMDGLATGISLISAITIWAVSVDFRINQPAGALMAATIAGALLGFLRWNFNPARIFLGDSGAYLTGFILASLTASFVIKKVTLVVMTPALILIFALPILDTILAVIRRTINKKSILEPDKEHLHHRMLAFGFSQKIVSYVLYFISSALGLLATFLISTKSSLRFVLLSLLIMGIALFYTFIINWKHQKSFRDFFTKSKS